MALALIVVSCLLFMNLGKDDFTMDGSPCFECLYFNPCDCCCDHSEVGFIGCSGDDPACGYFELAPEFEPI